MPKNKEVSRMADSFGLKIGVRVKKNSRKHFLK